MKPHGRCGLCARHLFQDCARRRNRSLIVCIRKLSKHQVLIKRPNVTVFFQSTGKKVWITCGENVNSRNIYTQEFPRIFSLILARWIESRDHLGGNKERSDDRNAVRGLRSRCGVASRPGERSVGQHSAPLVGAWSKLRTGPSGFGSVRGRAPGAGAAAEHPPRPPSPVAHLRDPRRARAGGTAVRPGAAASRSRALFGRNGESRRVGLGAGVTASAPRGGDPVGSQPSGFRRCLSGAHSPWPDGRSARLLPRCQELGQLPRRQDAPYSVRT